MRSKDASFQRNCKRLFRVRKKITDPQFKSIKWRDNSSSMAALSSNVNFHKKATTTILRFIAATLRFSRSAKEDSVEIRRTPHHPRTSSATSQSQSPAKWFVFKRWGVITFQFSSYIVHVDCKETDECNSLYERMDMNNWVYWDTMSSRQELND